MHNYLQYVVETSDIHIFILRFICIVFKLFTFFFQVIQEAIDVFQQKNETFKLASKEPNSEDHVSGIIF